MKDNVMVASANPVKIDASRIGFEKMFPDLTLSYEGISVPSGVSDQPMSNEETLKGAETRVRNIKYLYPDANYWVGIEGGIEKSEGGMEAFAWVVICSNEMKGKSRTATFFLPARVIELIEQGKEMGEADDIVFGHSNSKQKNGVVGLLTDNVRNRTSYYTEAVILALIPFKNLHLYNQKGK